MAVSYTHLTNAFAGTLKGVEEKLPYIQECGVNYLHLMPLLESPKGRSDGGYAVSNFRRVQPLSLIHILGKK